MRLKTLVFSAVVSTCVALAWPAPARGQSDASSVTSSGQTGGGTPPGNPPTWTEPTMPAGWWSSSIDVGFRGTTVDGDRSWFERYRDLRGGAFANVRFMREGEDWSALVVLQNPGYRDQRYYAQYARPGRMRAFLEWDQIPTFFGESTQTPYTDAGNGTLVLSPAARQAVQNGASQADLYLPLMQKLETRSGRDTFRAGLLYNLTRSLDAQVSVTSYKRSGVQPWSMSFGFAESVEVPLPVNQRQTDIDAQLEWSSPTRMFRVSWDGSWFNDNVQSFDSSPSLAIDSPLRFTSAANNPAQGRMSLPPSDTSQTVTGAGMIKLPGRSQLSANVAVGAWRQNGTLLPLTINTALPQFQPDRSTADLDVRRVSTYLSLTSRPIDSFFIDARYRVYDYSNQSAPFNASQVAVYDQAIGDEGITTLYSHRRQNLDVTGTYSRWRPASFSIGYELERFAQNERFYTNTNDNGVRASIDSATWGPVTLHGIYQHSMRNGSGANLAILTDAGEPEGLRRYDVANRTRDQVTAMAQVLMTNALAVTASVSANRNDYTDATFGLQRNTGQAYTVGLDLLPGGAVSAGIAYGLEKYSALQQSHQTSTAPPGDFTNTGLNWSNDEGSTVNYVTANLNLLGLVPKTEIVLAYDFNRSDDKYTYSVGAALPPPAQWPPVVYEWQELHADARYFILNKRAAIGASWWFSKMKVDDFAFGPPIIDNPIQPGGILLGYGSRPFTGNVGWLHLQYFF